MYGVFSERLPEMQRWGKINTEKGSERYEDFYERLL
jgi:hypothetical protein